MSTLQVSRGFTYHYIHYPPSLDPAPGPYVLFLHGWPSYSQEWHHQIDHFRKLGYGVIAPDLIGSGRSSRPSDVNNYVLKDITADVIEILDHEKISTVYAVGHDWGSFLLARLGVYYPERVERLCFIAVGYRAPGQPVDLDAINRMTAQKLGYSIFGYQVYFTRNDQADAALLEHKDSILSLVYPEEPELWKEHMGPIGSLEKWLQSDRRAEWARFLTKEDHQAREDNTTKELGGVPNLKWYQANAANLNYEAEKDLTDDQKHLRVPTLLIACEKDHLAVADLQLPQMKPWVSDLTVKRLDTGHWAYLERPLEVNKALEDLFNKRSTG